MNHEHRIGVQGWEQFLTGRRRMLNDFDRARVQAKAHEVAVHHGKVAEAVFRDWLGTFLPMRFGVCSGYIVSQGMTDTDDLPHFDVIIYDQLNSPVLWVEDHPDSSKSGASRAIPAEHVRAVIEVKSSLTPATAKAATTHLEDLRPLLQVDPLNEQYPRYLPPTFVCMSVFFEVPKTRPPSVLEQLLPAEPLRGYAGGFVLRAKDDATDTSCRIMVWEDVTEPASKFSQLSPASLHLPAAYSRVHNGHHRWAFATWGVSLFSWFAFDLVAMVAGTYTRGRLSSKHALRMARPTSPTVKVSDIPKRDVSAPKAVRDVVRGGKQKRRPAIPKK